MENTALDKMMPIRYIPLIILFLGISAGCGTNSSPAGGEVTENIPDQEAWNTTIYLIEDDQQRIVVTAAHRMYYEKNKQTLIDEGLYVKFFDEEGVLASTLTGDRAIINEQSRDMTVYGNVKIVSPSRGTLETDSLRWVETDNKFRTDAPVRIETKKDLITGIGFEADPGLSNWEILRNIQGRFDRGNEFTDRMDKPEKNRIEPTP